MKYLYYPGCSLKGTAREYDESFRAVAPILGIAYSEMEEWNCCGATAAKSLDAGTALRLPGNNLRRAQAAGRDLLVLCPSCHLNHQDVLNRASKDAGLQEQWGAAPLPRVKHLLEVLAFETGPSAIGERVSRPLKGLRALPYYGCLVIRPHALGGKESLENPRAMETVIRALGAEALSFPERMECCGGALVLTKEKIALKLAGEVLKAAKRCSPDCIVVACPLCAFMLDAKQRSIEKEIREKIGLPVLYLTQLLGLALGAAPKALGLHRLVTPFPALRSRFPA
ncbi:MAG TPA: CoB--CoM heterodisulfide reductase iron-sulfur subunit B family protein [Thermodesulfobacteriota bacterium]|nr:CoB--CoM heterodisulfide reductase iron-sulfur subunit B family protein [Thermodesulfobacteriota bacterium]